MEELNYHAIYKLLENKYSRLALDYVVFSTNMYEGLETHKNAVIHAIKIINERYGSDFDIEEDKMKAMTCDIDDLLKLPDDDYYNSRQKGDRGFNIPEVIPYWYAFLEPPYTVQYLTSDFIEFNDVLFPKKKDVEVYRWNDNFSNYFDDGKEWWGTGLWSAYDKTAEIMVIIGASVTD